MKKISIAIAGILLFAACQPKETSSTSNEVTDTTQYAYTLKKDHHWEMNSDHKNLQTALKAIKAFASLDTSALKPLIGDSIELTVDYYQFKGTGSQFMKEAQSHIDKFKSIEINMTDWESVISKDKTEEWVSLWYNQVSNMKDGKTDTISYFNDFKLKNGKIVAWSEYAQHPMKK
ncbi:hypothetical protein [Pedobacter rhizosphaerae]|uniref:SnoaL-like domain-containing protein n=1 Tax=Pedobacter rhizosphaerae TaxID=390241 RepID=A0A1H9M726_9SPHI|nr:hypothetical protein [Pedobacter rhizosphaerae]SER19239.1 hypothetical protein SAMN04488023_105123 [Pedobacter rhizosphaerae]